MKVSSPSMLGLLACSGIGFVAAEEDGLAIDDNITFVYIAYFSDSSCSQFAGIKPILPKDSPTEFTIARKDGDGNDIPCHDAMACIALPDGPTCKSFVGENPDIASINYTLYNDGSLYECDPSNIAVGQPECATLDYSVCFISSIYNCHFEFLTQDMLETSLSARQQQGTVDEVPAGTAEEDGLAIDDNSTFVYIAYFSDSSCSQFEAIKPILPKDSPTEFDIARKDGDGNDIPCHDAMACIAMPDGPTCKTFVGEDPEIISVNFTLYNDGSLYECDPSNIAVGQPECATLDYLVCTESSAYNCHFEFLTQDMLETSLSARQQQGTVDEVPAGTSSAACSWLSPSSVGSLLGVVLVFGLL